MREGPPLLQFASSPATSKGPSPLPPPTPRKTTTLLFPKNYNRLLRQNLKSFHPLSTPQPRPITWGRIQILERNIPEKPNKHFKTQTEFHAFIKKLELQAQETAEERLPLYHTVDIPHAHRILDVGCGSGFVTRDIARLTTGTVIGIDGSLQLLSVAKTILSDYPNTHLIMGDAHHLPFPTGTFDIVTCNLLLMWVDHPQAVVTEMARVTTPGGRVLASLEPDYGGKIHWPENPTIDPFFAGEAIRKRGGDPHIGRKLRSLFVTAGLHTTIGIGNNRIWTCDEDKHYYLHSRDYYITVLTDAGVPATDIDRWEYDYLKSLDDGHQLNFFPQFYAIGTKPKTKP